MFDSSRGRVDDPEVVGTGASVVGRGPVVPDDHHLLRRLEVPNGADVTLAAVLKIFKSSYKGSIYWLLSFYT